MSCVNLAKCKNLKFVEFGCHLDNFEKIPYQNLLAVKKFIKHKESRL